VQIATIKLTKGVLSFEGEHKDIFIALIDLIEDRAEQRGREQSIKELKTN